MTEVELQKHFANRNVLITGGLGFIGSNLAIKLASLDARITLLDSLIPEYGGNLWNIEQLGSRVTVNIGDVRDPYGIAYLVRGKDFIFNLAGQTSHLDSMNDPHTDLEINCRSQLFLLEACRKNNPEAKIVYASTRQVYGKPRYLPVDERHPLCPVDVNGINKISGENYHFVYGSVYGLKTSVLRLTNTYGPRMRIKDARQTFLGWWIRLLLEGKTIEIYGDGTQLRDFNYVDDAVIALLFAGVSGTPALTPINLGADEVISLKDLAQMMIDIHGAGEARIIPFPPDRKAIDIGDYYGDHSLASKCLGWQPVTSLAEGLKRTLGYFRTHFEKYI